jgi:hypothetical protein
MQTGSSWPGLLRPAPVADKGRESLTCLDTTPPPGGHSKCTRAARQGRLQ